MRSREIVVRCIYGEESDLLDLLKESFRLFLRCTMAGDGAIAASDLQCLR